MDAYGEMMARFKCPICYTIVPETPCPVCGYIYPTQMCELDRVCTCVEDITEGLDYCEKCGQAICPCGSHDVSQVSRVTGYLADVDGMNMGKQQEIKDRMRYVLLDGAWIKRGGNRD